MLTPRSLSKSDLRAMIGHLSDNDDLISLLIQTMFVPRFIRSPDAAITLNAKMAGACIISTSAAPVTVTLPAGLEPGFICTFLQLGAGGITYSGTHIGGSTSTGVNTFSAAMVLDDSTWLVYGSVS